jgi:flagellar biosynthesis/type III secretory pathway protein FliH
MSAEPFVFEPLETRGELIPAAASPADRASEIVASARAQAAQIESEARAEGYRAGRAEGLAAAEQERAATSAALGGVLAALQESREAYLAATERDVVELAVAIAEKIVGAALVADPELVCNLVAGALRAVEGGNGVVLEVNPDDVELVQRWLDASTLPLAAKIELRAERRIARGGCVVRTPEGEIDARVREQLDRAEEVLRETLAAAA